MNKILIVCLILAGCFSKTEKTRPANMTTSPNSTASIYQITINALDGTPIDLGQWKGKKILIVNTASECGFTPQYEELQKLHEKYGNNVAVLGIPSNDFGGQEPGSNVEIQNFCRKNYGVTFQMAEKVRVKGPEKHPLYQWLSDKSKNGWNEEEPSWNFCKYLLNEKGELVKYWSSKIAPLSEEVIKEIAE